jgi:LysR family glycine cleavage system transcriptional activator
MTPFVAPDYLACCGPLNTPADLLTCNLLHEDNHDCWIRWFSAAGIQETGTISGPVFADGGLIFQSVLRGQGIGLADRRLIQTDLDAGRLVQPFETRADYGHYWLVARDFKSLSPAGAKFAQWIGDAFS